MTAESIRGESTGVLIARFRDLARQIGTLYTLTTMPPATPERESAKKTLAAICAELRQRRPIAQIRLLYDDESVDVRAFAAIQFSPIDEDWAMAALSALDEGVTTGQMVAMCEHARRPPPKLPPHRQMTTDQLAARFEDAGIRRYATRFCDNDSEPYDVELSNRIVGEMSDIVEELRSREAVAALFPLLDHPNISVRTDAGRFCLANAPDRALPVLEAIVAGEDTMERGNASASIDSWRRRSNPKNP